MKSTDRQRRVEQRAYEIWEREGRPHGKHDEHWHQAAEEIARESGGGGGSSSGKSAPTSKPRAKTDASAKQSGGATSRTAKPAASARAGTGSTTPRRGTKRAGTPSSS